MGEGRNGHLIPRIDDIRELDFAIEHFCEEFNLEIVNRSLRADKLLAFCEFRSEIGIIHMFIEKKDTKFHFSAQMGANDI